MTIKAASGLTQNFGAAASLVTCAIQKVNMKMHLMNIMNQFECTYGEKEKIIEHFKTDGQSVCCDKGNGQPCEESSIKKVDFGCQENSP